MSGVITSLNLSLIHCVLYNCKLFDKLRLYILPHNRTEHTEKYVMYGFFMPLS